MPRPPRYFVPDIPLHIIQRGNNRGACFHSDDDRVLYLALLEKYAKRFGVAVHNFVLMTNHVHILATPSDCTGLSRCMQFVGTQYVRRFNRKHDRTGTLWEGRFKSFLVDSDGYFFTLCRYIEQNPVRAGMVKRCEDHVWSSYQGNALGKSIRILTPHPLYLSLGKSAEERRCAYAAMFENVLKPGQLKEIRQSVNKSQLLGSVQFKSEMDGRLGVRVGCKPRGGDRRSDRFRGGSERKSKGSE